MGNGSQTSKDLPALWEIQVQSLPWKDPLEKGTATPSSILAWRIPWTEEPDGLWSMGLAWKIPWTEEPGRLQSMGSLSVGHDS